MLKVRKKLEPPYSEAKNVTRNGTEKSTSTPWNIETNAISLPQAAVMTGRVESILVAPPVEIGASRPKTFLIAGAKSNVIISLMIFAIRAMVPS